MTEIVSDRKEPTQAEAINTQIDTLALSLMSIDQRLAEINKTLKVISHELHTIAVRMP